MIRIALLVCLSIALAACAPQPPTADITSTPGGLESPATQTAAAIQTATAFIPTPTPLIETPTAPGDAGSPVPSEPPQAQEQFIAYISNGQLLVTNVTNGVQGGTTQYTLAGESDRVSDLAWSPSGEFVAFVSAARGEPHVFYIFALGQSTPTDLGPGSAPAWSPDSQSLAYVGGTFPDENIWITPIDNPAPRQLTFDSNYAWGRPAFTPDGASLVVAGTSRDNLGASGNTSFILESLALDGSGARTPLPGAARLEGVRLPYDLRFSPDGSRLSFSTSYHWNACASPGAYYVSSPDGSNRQELVSPSLKPAIDANQERFHVGLSYGWTPASDGLVALGSVVDCNMNSPASGQVIAGPQMSILGLDGSERLIIPGFFYGISLDRSGTMIAAARHQEGFQDTSPTVEIFSAESGQPLLSLGPGSDPEFQP